MNLVPNGQGEIPLYVTYVPILSQQLGILGNYASSLVQSECLPNVHIIISQYPAVYYGTKGSNPKR